MCVSKKSRVNESDLSVRDRVVLTALAMGAGPREASYAGSCTEGTVQRVKNSPGGQAYLNRLKERIKVSGDDPLEDFGKGLRALSDTILCKVRKMVEEDWESIPVHLRFQLFRDVMDRTGHGKESLMEHRIGLFTDADAVRLKQVRSEVLELPRRSFSVEREEGLEESGGTSRIEDMGMSEEEARGQLVEALG